ncbi:MAG: hypothetical protein K2J63_05065 [Muribaculaceae bacterium]|nr:hypothetical protein [Muribaculaceae bacterium]
MKTSVIKKHILGGLAPYVKDYGFKIVKSQFEIVRKDKEKSFRWVFINEKPLWEDENTILMQGGRTIMLASVSLLPNL